MPNILLGGLSLLTLMSMHALRLVGCGYSDPDGKLSVIYPGLLICLVSKYAEFVLKNEELCVKKRGAVYQKRGVVY